jgi:carbon-monoxide dehydrogenase medium subunit
MLLTVDGTITVKGASGQREIAAADLFQNYMETAIEFGEVLTEVRIPTLDGYGSAYEKFTRRAEDWAMVGVCAVVKRAGDGSCEDVRIGLTNMGSTPLRARAVEEALAGQPATENAVRAAAARAADGANPPSDLNGDADYRRHLATVLTRRAVLKAAGA